MHSRSPGSAVSVSPQLQRRDAAAGRKQRLQLTLLHLQRQQGPPLIKPATVMSDVPAVAGITEAHRQQRQQLVAASLREGQRSQNDDLQPGSERCAQC